MHSESLLFSPGVPLVFQNVFQFSENEITLYLNFGIVGGDVASAIKNEDMLFFTKLCSMRKELLRCQNNMWTIISRLNFEIHQHIIDLLALVKIYLMVLV